MLYAWIGKELGSKTKAGWCPELAACIVTVHGGAEHLWPPLLAPPQAFAGLMVTSEFADSLWGKLRLHKWGNQGTEHIIRSR